LGRRPLRRLPGSSGWSVVFGTAAAGATVDVVAGVGGVVADARGDEHLPVLPGFLVRERLDFPLGDEPVTGDVVVLDALDVVVVGDERGERLPEVGEGAVLVALLAFLPEPDLDVRVPVDGFQLLWLGGDESPDRRACVDRHDGCSCSAPPGSMSAWVSQVHPRPPGSTTGCRVRAGPRSPPGRPATGQHRRGRARPAGR